MSTCAICDAPYTGSPSQDFLICDGICGKPYHYTCIGFKPTLIKAFKESRNLFWQCDQCVHTPLKVITTALAELRLELASIKTYMKYTTDLNASLMNLSTATLPTTVPATTPTTPTPSNNATLHIHRSSVTASPAHTSMEKRTRTVPSPIDDTTQDLSTLKAPTSSAPNIVRPTPTASASSSISARNTASPTPSAATSSLISARNTSRSTYTSTSLAQDLSSYAIHNSSSSQTTISENSTAASCTASLTVIQPPKSLFLSRLSHNTSAQDVINYISSKLPSPPAYLHCTKLTPDNNTNRIIASFRLDVPPELADTFYAPFWPAGTLIKDYVPRRRSTQRTTQLVQLQQPSHNKRTASKN